MGSCHKAVVNLNNYPFGIDNKGNAFRNQAKQLSGYIV